MKENREKEKDEKERGKESGIVTRESVSAVCALFSALAFLILCTRSLIFGNIGIAVNSFLLGLFGYLAYPILLAAVYLSVASFIGKRFVRNRKVAATLAVAVVCAMLIVHTAFTYSWDLSGYLSRCFRAPGEGAHGIDAATPAGWAGALLVYPLARLTTRIGALVIFSVLFLLFAYLSVYFWAGKSLPRRAKKTEGKAEKGRGESALPGSGMPAGGEGTFSPPVRENRVRSDGEPVYGTPWPNGSPAAGQARTPRRIRRRRSRRALFRGAVRPSRICRAAGGPPEAGGHPSRRNAARDALSRSAAPGEGKQCLFSLRNAFRADGGAAGFRGRCKL